MPDYCLRMKHAFWFSFVYGHSLKLNGKASMWHTMMLVALLKRKPDISESCLIIAAAGAYLTNIRSIRVLLL